MSPPTYELRYPSVDELKTGYNQHIQHGGAFVISETVPTALSEVALTISLPDESSWELAARVVNIMPAGFFVQFIANETLHELKSTIEKLLNAPPTTETVTDTVTMDAGQAEPSPAGEGRAGIAPALSGPMQNVWKLIDNTSGVPLGQQVRALSVADRIRLARHANRPVRALLIRDTEKRIHVEVVKNPKTTDDEIVDWSGLSGISPLALKWISTQKRLMRNRKLQLNLVKNPMTPQNIAIKLVKVLHISDCRKIAKSSQVREAIARVARKRVAEAVERM